MFSMDRRPTMNTVKNAAIDHQRWSQPDERQKRPHTPGQTVNPPETRMNTGLARYRPRSKRG